MACRFESHPTLGSPGFKQAHLIDLAPPSSPKLVKIITLTKTKNGDSSLEIFGILLVNLVAVFNNKFNQWWFFILT